MFRLISRYIFREIFTSSVLGTLLATSVVFLQKIDRLFEVLVGSNPDPKTIATLFALTLPPVLPLTIPFGVLVGILIGLGRMSSDGEITAMRAAGVSSRRVIAPVLAFAVMGAALAGLASLRLTPYSLRKSTEILNRLIANQISAEIQPRDLRRGFPEHHPVRRRRAAGRSGGLAPGVHGGRHRAGQTQIGLGEKADGPMITVARVALATSDTRNNRIQLQMRDYSTHEMGKDGVAHDEAAPVKTIALDPRPPEQRALASSAMNTSQLMHYRGPDWIEVGIELHNRFALPLACIVLALVGIPLGISTRKGGKSAGYVNAIFLAFFGYYLSSVSLVGVAKQRTLPVPVAIWLPDVVFGLAGILFLYRMETSRRPRPADRPRGICSGAIFDQLKSRTKTHAGSGAFFRLAPAAAAADHRHLHPLQLPVLHARGAGEFRLDGGGLQFLRADGRHARATARS